MGHLTNSHAKGSTPVVHRRSFRFTRKRTVLWTQFRTWCQARLYFDMCSQQRQTNVPDYSGAPGCTDWDRLLHSEEKAQYIRAGYTLPGRSSKGHL